MSRDAAAPAIARAPAWRRLTALRLIVIVCFAAALVFPLFGNPFYTRLAVEALLLGMLALSVDILLGVVGLLSLGQAAFFGLAAYAAALMLIHVTTSFWAVLVVVVAVTTAVSLMLGAVAIRTRGVYFALITFGFGEILYKISSHTYAIGGTDGLLGVPTAVDLGFVVLPPGNHLVFFYFVLALFSAIYLLVARLLDSPFGLVLRAIHENEDRVAYLSFDPVRYKLAAYVLAANVAALGGMIYPVLRGFAGPNLFSFETSIKAVVMALVGGLGTLIGAFVGGAGVTFLETALSAYTRHHLMVIGLLFILCVLFFPSGLVGMARDRLARHIGGRG